MIIPPYLKKGDLIGITCPAGYLYTFKAKRCIETLQEWGFEVMVGKTVGSASNNYFSGTDEERLQELQAMLDEPSIKAILFGRGGYGCSRIIDQLNFKKFKKNPKWLVGFSDITVFHNHLHARMAISSIHGPMAGAFNLKKKESEAYILSIKNALTGKKIHIECDAKPLNRSGVTNATLVGGNLTLIVNMIGTRSEINTKNKILFIEDLGEHKYNIDRLMVQLKRSGKLKDLKGLIVGGFTDIRDTERPFGKTIEEIIAEAVSEYDFPVCFGFPISHGKENYAVKIGVEYQLKINSDKTTLLER
jgi:muramoyltetrapeptide carboxypeptidase